MSPTPTSSYIQDLPGGSRAIPGISTAVTAFVGVARQGPPDQPTLIHSYQEYERDFGGLATDSEMSYAVRQFFLNGGAVAWVVRVIPEPLPPNPTEQDKKKLLYSLFIPDRTQRKGIYALEAAVPGTSSAYPASPTPKSYPRRQPTARNNAPSSSRTPPTLSPLPS